MTSTTVPDPSVETTLSVLVQTAELLLLNGQTTRRTVTAVQELGTALHYRTDVFPRWGQLTVRLWDRGVPHDAILIAVSAILGAALRRWLTRISSSPFLPPFAAALVAGIIGAIVVDLDLSPAQQLVAVCPCMVLVPGPHLLNGALDLARAEISLGVARITYASVTILMICAGLLLGLAIGGVPLPASGATTPAPLFYDVIAAGVAVAAYGTFFSLPWRMLPIPVLIGMLAHAARWAIVTAAGLRIEMGAFVACLIVGVMVTPLAERLRLPFAGIAFASVVSLIPGIFLFRMGGGLLTLIALGVKAPTGLLQDVVVDAATAFLIVLAMVFGLIIPKLSFELSLRSAPRKGS